MLLPNRCALVLRLLCVASTFVVVSTARAQTCHAPATFGSDGQAFVCLRDEDTPPVSPDPALVIVEERPEILAGFDYFDGWLPGDD